MLRPIRSEYLIRFSAEEQIKRQLHLLLHDLTRKFIKIWHSSTAILEPARRILFGPARCLHHAVERHKFCNNDFSHVDTSKNRSIGEMPGKNT